MPPKKHNRPQSAQPAQQAQASASTSTSTTTSVTPSSSSSSSSSSTSSSTSVSSAASIAAEQNLPAKYQTIFRQILKLYETKQYKKALKSTEEILKKYPNHGETLAMRGLTFNCLSRSAEAHELVKRGLSCNMQSHVCWHVYGLLYRAEHKYNDAIKCYQQALKRDSDNQQILKDLSSLQIQRRMLAGFTETRRKIVVSKPGSRNNWLAFACGHHLQGQFRTAMDIIDKYLNIQIDDKNKEKDSKPVRTSYEDSELRLYRSALLEESGDHAGALSYLDSLYASKLIVDVLYYKERKADLLLKLKRLTEAEAAFRALIKINSENHAYHKGLWKSLGLYTASVDERQHSSTIAFSSQFTNDQRKGLYALYDELAKQYPQSNAVSRLPLDFSIDLEREGKESDPAFSTRLDRYLQNGLRKGLPSLFSDIRPLYKDGNKHQIIEAKLREYIKNLETHHTFTAPSSSSSSSTSSGSSAQKKESPVALLWTYYFISHHFDYLNKPTLALQFCQSAISHTPTLLDLYVLLARIYKHSGDFSTAFHYMDVARRLDTADRYLNTKCVRYALRANLITEASNIVALFLRDTDASKALGTLADMQVQWFELQAGRAHARLDQPGRALKHFLSVQKHFFDFQEDQFDFHSYCLRKVTMRAYTNMLSWEDNIKSHRFAFKAAQELAKIYLQLHYASTKAAEASNESNQESSLTDEEKKAAEKKRRREAAKAKREEEAKKATAVTTTNNKKDKGEDGTVLAEDSDPEGLLLTKVASPLDEAAKYASQLQFYSPSSIESHIISATVFTLKNKLVRALQAIIKGRQIQQNNPKLHVQLANFILKVGASRSSYNSIFLSVIDSELTPILSSLSSSSSANTVNDSAQARSIVRSLNDVFIKSALSSSSSSGVRADHLLAACEVDRLIGDDASLSNLCRSALNVTLDENDLDSTSSWSSIEDLIKFFNSLTSSSSSSLSKGAAEAASSLSERAKKRYPLTPAFGAPKPNLDEDANASAQDQDEA